MGSHSGTLVTTNEEDGAVMFVPWSRACVCVDVRLRRNNDGEHFDAHTLRRLCLISAATAVGERG